ncbi:esterase [Scandinavium sp. TWS1a]|uniref:esterase n=1 Tax=Scandinavium tedordense TaxID=2926521 RepID=UPI0021661C90|nr:esterase [Scandinavium tedordense]MCS2169467.1 esterase [Scandinavium tedordense]
MIELEMRKLAGSEILHAFPRGKADCALPCIVFYHGFTSSKQVYSYFAVTLALAGFRVIMPDALDHGSRFSGDDATRMQRFWPILLNSCHEFAALKEAIVEQGWLEEDRLAVAGASMGGMTALGIMTHHPEVKCVASLMGSGYLTSLSRSLFPSLETPAELTEWDVGHQLEKLATRPLLLWHGEDDDVVPAAETFRLQQAMQQQGLDRKLTCHWQAGVRHRITPEALDVTVAFFKQFL